MKGPIIIILLFGLGSPSFAQDEPEGLPVSVGIVGYAGIRPGIKIGTHFDLKKRSSEKASHSLTRTFYLNPQIGFYTHPNVLTGYLFNTDVGYKRTRNDKNKYTASSIGLGLLNQSRISNRVINLGDGSASKNRENQLRFLITLNYEFGKAINTNIGWYSKLSYGYEIPSTNDIAATGLIELGVRFLIF